MFSINSSKMNITMCMLHYINNLLTMVYKVYEPVHIEVEEHWGQWSIIDE